MTAAFGREAGIPRAVTLPPSSGTDRRTPALPRGGARPGCLLDPRRPAGVPPGRGTAVPRPATVSLLGELWDFMRVRKKWWLGPIVIVLALFGALIVFTQGSALAPKR